MTQPTARFHDCQIEWRGSKPTFGYMPRDQAAKLRTVFSGHADWFEPWAQQFVADLDRAIEEYDTWEMSLPYEDEGEAA